MINNRSVSGLAVAGSAPRTPASVETAVWARRGCAAESRHRANATARARSFLIKLAGILLWESRERVFGRHGTTVSVLTEYPSTGSLLMFSTRPVPRPAP